MAKLLILDDKKHVRDLLQRELACAGHAVRSTGDPVKAKEVILSWRPDLLLLDLYLGKRDRWDVLAEIREAFPAVRVLIVSAFDGYPHDPRMAMADGFVRKSASMADLNARVRAALSRTSTRRSLGRRPTPHPLSSSTPA